MQKEILSFFCKNFDLLNQDGAIIAYDGIRWTINCLFNASNSQNFNKKKKCVDYLLLKDDIQHQLSYFKAKEFKDSLYKYLLQHKMSYTICLIHKLFKILNK